MAVVEKRFTAEVTHERFGGAVKKHVRFQLVVLNEALATGLTGERFFTGVNADVSFQILLEGETRAAGLAREGLSSVDRLVRPERSPHGEGFVTHAALERMLAGVNPSVTLQREGVPETLSALGALVGLLDGVNHLVGLEVALRFEGLPTSGARERPQVRVNNLMSL